jgi:hypothetical protein
MLSKEDKGMTGIKAICSKVADDMRWMIDQAIAFGDDRVQYEQEFGNGTVGVDYYPVRLKNGCCMMVKDVYVLHDRGTGCSPLLVGKLKDAIPNWEDIEREIENEPKICDEY